MSDVCMTAKEAQLAALEQAKRDRRRIYIYESIIGYTLCDSYVSWANYVGAVWPGGRMTWRKARDREE